MLIAIITQSGGCDYTVGCGTKIVEKIDNQSDSDFIHVLSSVLRL